MSNEHTNYTRYSKMNNEVVKTDDPIAENESAVTSGFMTTEDPVPETEVTTETESTVEPEPESVAEPVAIPEIRKFGKVVCNNKLNVRRLPDRGAAIVTEVANGTEVMIDEKVSTALFYKICTECGIEGYCMKDFIKVLP